MEAKYKAGERIAYQTEAMATRGEPPKVVTILKVSDIGLETDFGDVVPFSASIRKVDTTDKGQKTPPATKPGKPHLMKVKTCEDCGDEYQPTSNAQRRCPECGEKHRKEMEPIWKKGGQRKAEARTETDEHGPVRTAPEPGPVQKTTTPPPEAALVTTAREVDRELAAKHYEAYQVVTEEALNQEQLHTRRLYRRITELELALMEAGVPLPPWGKGRRGGA